MAGFSASPLPTPKRRALPASVGGSSLPGSPSGGQPAPGFPGSSAVLPNGDYIRAGGGTAGGAGLQFDPSGNTAAMGGSTFGPISIQNLNQPSAMPSVRASMPAPGGGAPAPDGAPAPPPIDMTQIMELVKGLKGDPVPREPAPAPLPRVAAPQPAAEQPSSSLGFARYKDRSGRIGAAALRAMRDEMTSRGISGSGIEADKTGDILTGVAQGQGDAAFQQSLEADRQAADFKKLGYQGDISQRANDMGLVGTGFSGGIQQRDQDMRSNDMTSLFPSIMSILMQQRRY